MLHRLRRLCRLCRLPHLLLLLGLLRRLRLGLWPQRRHQRRYQVLCGGGGCIKPKQIPHAIILQPIVVTLVPQLQLLLKDNRDNKRKRRQKIVARPGTAGVSCPSGRLILQPAVATTAAAPAAVFAMHGSSECSQCMAAARVGPRVLGCGW